MEMEVKTEVQVCIRYVRLDHFGVLECVFQFRIGSGQEMATVANEAWKAANPGKENFYIVTMLSMLFCYGGSYYQFYLVHDLNARQ
jgi:hypothetical protein